MTTRAPTAEGKKSVTKLRVNKICFRQEKTAPATNLRKSDRMRRERSCLLTLFVERLFTVPSGPDQSHAGTVPARICGCRPAVSRALARVQFAKRRSGRGAIDCFLCRKAKNKPARQGSGRVLPTRVSGTDVPKWGSPCQKPQTERIRDWFDSLNIPGDRKDHPQFGV